MRTRAFLLVLLSLAALPAAAARADTPWSAPAPLSGSSGAYALIFTGQGHGVVAGGKSGSTVEADTVVATLHSDGRPGTSRDVALFNVKLAAYASDHYVIAGLKPASTSSSAAKAPVQYVTASPGTPPGTPKSLSDTGGQQLYRVAGGPNGIVAFVTGTTSGSLRRYVWIRKSGNVKKALTIKLSSGSGGAAVAVGKNGDVLVAWEDAGKIQSRHIGTTGNVASAHTLGDGVQSQIQARYDDSGRQEVAWQSQRKGEGFAHSPADTYYTSAASGHGFTSAKLVGEADLQGTGVEIIPPGVRLVGSGTDSGVLAYNVYDGTHLRVQVANVAGGTVQTPVTVSPDDEDAELGDLAYARAGGTLVLWRSGARGNNVSGPQRVLGNWRPAGAADFAAPEAVSAETVPASPLGAVNPVSGKAVAAWSYLADQSVYVSARS